MSNEAAIKSVTEAAKELGSSKLTYTLEQSKTSGFDLYKELKEAGDMKALLGDVEISGGFYRVKVKDEAGRFVLVPVDLAASEAPAKEEPKAAPKAEEKPKEEAKAEEKPKEEAKAEEKPKAEAKK